MSGFWRDRTVVVTGGGRGIGLELTRGLCRAGACVIAVGRSAASVEAVAAEFPGRVEPRVCDLERPEEVDALVAELSARPDSIDVLVNNAALQVERDLFDADRALAIADARREIALNLAAPVALSVGLLPVLSRRQGAAIVNLSSVLALWPKPSAPVYCASKAGLKSFTLALRYQAERHGGTVSVIEAVMPLVETDMTRGRGSGKISAAKAAQAVLDGMGAGKSEIWVGKSALVRLLNRIAPGVVRRMMRGS